MIRAASWLADISQRFFNEVRVCILLHNRGVNVVPFVGIFPTEIHPFCIVYEYIGNLDLKQYLRSEPDAGRLKLVFIPFPMLDHGHLTLLGNSWWI